MIAATGGVGTHLKLVCFQAALAFRNLQQDSSFDLPLGLQTRQEHFAGKIKSAAAFGQLYKLRQIGQVTKITAADLDLQVTIRRDVGLLTKAPFLVKWAVCERFSPARPMVLRYVSSHRDGDVEISPPTRSAK
jgi:hypothetical protein